MRADGSLHLHGSCQQASLAAKPLAAMPVVVLTMIAACLVMWLVQTLVQEGVKGIYKGISAPLATVAVFNAVLFASRGQMEVLLKHTDGETAARQGGGALYAPNQSASFTATCTSAAPFWVLVGLHAPVGIWHHQVALQLNGLHDAVHRADHSSE